mmetsp:Transcript_15760/g.29732  ORF Transcript_15760/g.29732 Transcript_15760/m.29732 type:complete len:106 (+) Transcript_15760:75-392(+)
MMPSTRLEKKYYSIQGSNKYDLLLDISRKWATPILQIRLHDITMKVVVYRCCITSYTSQIATVGENKLLLSEFIALYDKHGGSIHILSYTECHVFIRRIWSYFRL